ncbi:MAG: hypothetical protein ACXW6V_24600, partial [Candidatus Binatia bacterium]
AISLLPNFVPFVASVVKSILCILSRARANAIRPYISDFFFAPFVFYAASSPIPRTSGFQTRLYLGFLLQIVL